MSDKDDNQLFKVFMDKLNYFEGRLSSLGERVTTLETEVRGLRDSLNVNVTSIKEYIDMLKEDVRDLKSKFWWIIGTVIVGALASIATQIILRILFG